ncbi:peptidoglycan-binding domain-containing protein [Mucilaginibacter sp.]|uniref:peptidoglycan-binding domain-containing protein n=1 Tax=Mucilaginibacter sp. TaxID=1882438 RepID=UPI003D0A87FA
MHYPGYAIQQNEIDITVVKSIQQQLNEKGCGPLKVNGDFDLDTRHAIVLFQTRFTDQYGNPLKADGIIGPVTWATLFNEECNTVITDAPNGLLANVLDVARSQVGVMEFPTGSNNGLKINKYQDSAGIPHGEPWSMAFIYWCFKQASSNLRVTNPAYKTGGVIDMWCKTTSKRIQGNDAKLDISLVLPGQIFIISTGGGNGHAGLVEKNENGLLTTIEGSISINANYGIGVFRRTRRVDAINIGFIELD